MADEVALGVYIGIPGYRPDDEQRYNSFCNAMQRKPVSLTTFVSYHDGWGSGMTNHASWAADMHKNAGYSHNCVPLLGVPMATNTDHSPGQAFADIAAGHHDGDFNSIFRSFSWLGKLTIRPGWEKNGDWYFWKVKPNDVEAYKRAFRHIADLAHRFDGCEVTVSWNPVAPGSPPDQQGKYYEQIYPGDDAVDIVSVDTYGIGAGYIADEQVFDTQNWSATTCAHFAVAHNKPMGIDETGTSAAGSPNFCKCLKQALLAVPGLRMHHLSMWDDPSGGGNNIYWSDDPNAAAAWRDLYNSVKHLTGEGSSSPPDTGNGGDSDAMVSPAGAGIWMHLVDDYGDTFMLQNGQISINGQVDPATHDVIGIFKPPPPTGDGLCHQHTPLGEWRYHNGAWELVAWSAAGMAMLAQQQYAVKPGARPPEPEVPEYPTDHAALGPDTA